MLPARHLPGPPVHGDQRRSRSSSTPPSAGCCSSCRSQLQVVGALLPARVGGGPPPAHGHHAAALGPVGTTGCADRSATADERRPRRRRRRRGAARPGRPPTPRTSPACCRPCWSSASGWPSRWRPSPPPPSDRSPRSTRAGLRGQQRRGPGGRAAGRRRPSGPGRHHRGHSYLHPSQLAGGFRSAMLIASTWCVIGGLGSMAGIRNPAPGGTGGTDRGGGVGNGRAHAVFLVCPRGLAGCRRSLTHRWPGAVVPFRRKPRWRASGADQFVDSVDRPVVGRGQSSAKHGVTRPRPRTGPVVGHDPVEDEARGEPVGEQAVP